MMTTVVQSVVLAGGGSAGHVNPLLAVADEIRRREPDAQLLVLGTATGLEAELVPARGYELRHVPRVPLPRRPSADILALPGRLRDAVRVAHKSITDIDAQAVIGFGGYVSTPAYLAARRARVPVVIHEQNAHPGLANRLGARWASRVGVTFPETPLPGAVMTGLPLRAEIARLVQERATDATAVRARAAHELGLDPARRTLVVTGGSLGALSLNKAVSGASQAITATGAQVLHLTGKGKDALVRDTLATQPDEVRARYQVRDYLTHMHLALAVADLVVCRSGAGTVSELAALGIPAVYVPLPIGNGEQRVNAAPVVDSGGGLIIDDADLTATLVADVIPEMLGDPDKLRLMAKGASQAGVRDGASRVVDLIAEAIA